MSRGDIHRKIAEAKMQAFGDCVQMFCSDIHREIAEAKKC